MKNTPFLFVLITASFASFPSACEIRNNNRKNQQYYQPQKGFLYDNRHTAGRKSASFQTSFSKDSGTANFLKLVSTVQCYRVCGKIEIFHALESGFLHQLPQLFLSGMHADGFGKISVAVRVLCDETPHRRKHFE